MSSYPFPKSGITKLPAFDAYMLTNFALYQGNSYSDPDLIVYTTEALDSIQLDVLQTLVVNYVDPEVFLILDTTTTDAARSKSTSSTTLEDVHTFIFSPLNPLGEGIFNALKTVIEYSTADISNFVSGSTACSVQFQIFDLTRDLQIVLETIDISDIIQTWQTLAQTESGPARVFRSLMIEGLRTSICTYDCIWQFKISVSNPNVVVRSHSMQRLYYQVL